MSVHHRVREELLDRIAAQTLPDKKSSVLFAVIELRKKISDLKKNHSWRSVCYMLSQSNIHVGEGTLRNYLRLIAAAEHRLCEQGTEEAESAQIHSTVAQLRRMERHRRQRPKQKKPNFVMQSPNLNSFAKTQPSMAIIRKKKQDL